MTTWGTNDRVFHLQAQLMMLRQALNVKVQLFFLFRIVWHPQWLRLDILSNSAHRPFSHAHLPFQVPPDYHRKLRPFSHSLITPTKISHDGVISKLIRLMAMNSTSVFIV